DVRDRGLDGVAPRPFLGRYPFARHLLRDRPLSLRGGAGNDLRVLRWSLLLVPESNRSEDERDARQDTLLDVVHRYERSLHADVLARPRRCVAQALRWRRVVCLRAARARVEYAELVVGLVPRSRADPLLHQLLIEPAARRGGRPQSVARDDG